MIKKLVILLSLFFSAQFNLSWAYDGEVHKKINEHAVKSGVSKLDFVLKNQLGFFDGIETKFKKQEKDQKVWEWLSFGGEAEDYGYAFNKDPITSRSYNHFHDPLKDWDDAGLDDFTLKNLYFSNYLRYPVSTLLWGLNPGEQYFMMNFTGDWSWGKAKESYYIYLTGKNFAGDIVADTEAERNTYLTDCFRALGQVMHLLQDMSVPLHTRNDVHIFPLFGFPKKYYTYETYTKNNIDILDFIPDQPGDIPDPHFFEVPVIIQDPNHSNMVPVVGLFDRNAYNASGSIPPSNILGLAEYSNANFLTSDTMWTYPHPSKADTNLDQVDWLHPEIIIADDGKIDARIYIKKTLGEKIDHLAVADYWTYEYFGHIETIPKGGLTLDDECWKEYADKLIPRAVGYSAALLNYFFRGELDVTCLPVFYQNNLRALSFKIKNMTSSQEAMSDGTFTLVCRYKDGNTDKSVLVDNVSSGTLVYNGEEVEINFTLPWSSGDERISKEEYESGVTCTLVFKGKLGNETGAVVGKSFVLGQEIKFNEEWDNGLTGNYPWIHSTAEQNPPNGITVNVIENGTLIKKNIRYAGFSTPRQNETFLYLPDPGIPINQYTSLQFKIDEFSSNVSPAYHWQVMMLYFNDGDLNLEFSVNGPWTDLGWPNVGYYSFTPEIITVGNIYKMFDDVGIQIPDPLYLNRIGFAQQLLELEDPSTTEDIQRMDVDFIRIIDAKPNP